MPTPFKMKGSPMKRNFGISPVKVAGASSLEIGEQSKKKSTDAVVDPDTSVVTSVGTQRLIDAGAPPEVIQKSKDKFIEEEKLRQTKISPVESAPIRNYKKGYYKA